LKTDRQLVIATASSNGSGVSQRMSYAQSSQNVTLLLLLMMMMMMLV